MPRRVLATCALTLLIFMAGCTKDSWDPKNQPSGPAVFSAPASPVAAACPLLSADVVGTTFGITGVQATEGKKEEALGGATVTCDYDKGLDFSLSLGVTSFNAAGDPAQAVKLAMNGDTTVQNITGLGQAAAYHTPTALVGQLVAIKRS